MLLALGCFCFKINAQSVNKPQKILILPGTLSQKLDSPLVIQPESIVVLSLKGDTLDNGYSFNSVTGKIQFNVQTTDTIWVYYRKLPSVFYKPFYKRPVTLIETEIRKDPFAYDPKRDGVLTTTDNALRTDGNISRGITAGNRQDLTVNSNLNMRLSGKIAEDITILGVISDDNNPIQPEGNTQQLQDFDKVFIMLTKDSNNMIVGDFEMKRPPAYFMNYYKKSRGFHLESQSMLKDFKWVNNADVALSRGRFARNTIQGIEGNQGPYRLSGVNGETFIIVISGTEVVYLDGRRLQRGESRDYIINYNTGEVIFMPAQMITKFSRIVVEFQYSDRNYQRTVFKVGTGLHSESTSFDINYFNEQDNKNQNFQQSLDGFDSVRQLSAKQILAQSGDNVQSAVIPNIKALRSFETGKLLYRKIDTLSFNDVFVYTDNAASDTVFYEVVFSYVGENRGHYRQKSSTANGRVFEWVAPIAGVLSGNYEPVELLVAPKRYQMLTVGLRRKIKQTETFVEGVYTNNNINTFSNQNKSNDDGFGISAGLTNVQDVAIRKKQFTLSNKLKTEIVNSDFRFLERYRPVEFERTWNKQLGLPQNTTTIKLPEIIANYDIELKQSDIFKLTYKTGLYYRSKDVNGLFNNLSSNICYKKTDFKAGFERMTNTIPLDSGNQSNAFFNYDFDLSHTFKPGKLGGAWHQERSTFQKQNDSIVSGSFAFNSGRVYFESTENERFNYGFSGERRIDRLPYLGGLNLSTQADELRWHGGYSHKKGGKLSLNGSYRHLNYLDTLVLKGRSEKNTLGRIEMDLPLLKKCLKLNTFYQIGSGQEQKREFTYLKVADGNGVYIWNDYDSNRLQTLNEFEIASDYDRKRANYIRTFIPVQGFLKSRNLQFNQTFNIIAPQAWVQKKGFRKMLSRLSVLIVYRTDRRTTSDQPSLYLNPFILTVNDLLLVNSNNALRYTLFVNRNNPLWSADINYLNTQSKSLLVNGYETRQSHETTLNARVNVSRNYGVLLQLNTGDRSYFSELLKTRNYVYKFYATEPRLQFTSSNNNIGATLLGRYYRAEADTIVSQNLEAGLELRVSKVSKGSFTGNFRLVNINFNGDAVSPLGYELMKGLLPGKNYTWNIVYQQRLSSNIQIDISYEGRKSQQSPVIHIGRVMARYLF